MTIDILEADSNIVTNIEGDSLLDPSPIEADSPIQNNLVGESGFDRNFIEYF